MTDNYENRMRREYRQFQARGFVELPDPKPTNRHQRRRLVKKGKTSGD